MKKSLYQLAVRYVSPIEVVGQGWGMGCKVVGTIPKLSLQGSLCQLSMMSRVSMVLIVMGRVDANEVTVQKPVDMYR